MYINNCKKILIIVSIIKMEGIFKNHHCKAIFHNITLKLIIIAYNHHC